jgi:HEAT repeat protein
MNGPDTFGRGRKMTNIEPSWDGRPASRWIEMLAHPEDEKRWRAVDALRHIAPPSESIRLLLDALQRDGYWRARALAAHALHDMAVDAENRSLLREAIGPLAEALSDSSSHVRLNAAYALESLGPEATAAVLALQVALGHDDEALRAAARDALEAIRGREASE